MVGGGLCGAGGGDVPVKIAGGVLLLLAALWVLGDARVHRAIADWVQPYCWQYLPCGG